MSDYALPLNSGRIVSLPPVTFRPSEFNLDFFGKGIIGRRLFDQWVESMRKGALKGTNWLFAGAKSNYARDGILQLYAGGVTFAKATNLYWGLWEAALSAASTGATGSESGYTSYARLGIGNGTATNDQTTGWNTVSSHAVTNKTASTFATSTGTNSTIISLGIVDSGTIGAGNMWWWADVTSTTIQNGDTPKINAAAVSISET